MPSQQQSSDPFLSEFLSQVEFIIHKRIPRSFFLDPPVVGEPANEPKNQAADLLRLYRSGLLRLRSTPSQ